MYEHGELELEMAKERYLLYTDALAQTLRSEGLGFVFHSLTNPNTALTRRDPHHAG
jgi:hypothetical protein